jgi:hypothetical protein
MQKKIELYLYFQAKKKAKMESVAIFLIFEFAENKHFLTQTNFVHELP